MIIDEDTGMNDDDAYFHHKEKRTKTNNNTSVMTNFNPMTALETYENSHMDQHFYN